MVAILAFFAGCYNEFEYPSYQKPWNDKSFLDTNKESEPLQLITIKDLKDLYINKFGLQNTGRGKDWATTRSLLIEDNLYIKGKVISNDREGNIYKSLFLDDGTAAIEIRLANGNFLKYHMGTLDKATMTIPSQWVYVKLKGLYLGNYKMMLSVGNGPTDSFNKVGEHKFYANSNISSVEQIAAHVFPGENATLIKDKNIKVVTKENYATELVLPDDLSRLVYFKGVKSYYAGVKDQNDKTADKLKNDIYDQIYPCWTYTDSRPIVSEPWYRMAFSESDKVTHKSTSLYGSSCFTFIYDDANEAVKPKFMAEKGLYIVRTSGYSRFTQRPIVKNGEKGDLLGIFGIYSDRLEFDADPSTQNGTFQVTINRFEDLIFNEDQFLTEDWVKENTPESSYNTPESAQEDL